MAVLKKNINRFRRVYPGIRKSPKYEAQVNVEAGYIDLSNESNGTYTYTLKYDEIPSVVGTPQDSTGAGTVNVNIWISAITKTDVEFSTSENMTGRIYLQVVGF
jgi:hypothetical protein